MSLLHAMPKLPALERQKRVRAPKISETAEHRTVADFFAVGLGGNAVAIHVRNERAGVGARIEAARMGILAGAPDWLIVNRGLVFGIELKPRGWRFKKLAERSVKLTAHELRQIEVHKRLARAGCPVAICESLSEVIDTLEAAGVPLRASVVP